MSTPRDTAETTPPDGGTFEAYERADGGPGVRNRVLVLPSVICSGIVAERIADRVPGAIAAAHDHGCAQLGADNDQTRRTLLGVAANPNVAGALVVGLGCEEVQSGDVVEDLHRLGVPVREVVIQDAGGTDETVERGVAAAEELVEGASADRTTADRSALTVGVVGGDLAGSTVETADPLVGSVVEDVVAAGGRVVAAGAERLLAHPGAAQEAREPVGAAAERPAEDDDERSVKDGMAALLERHETEPYGKRSVRRRAEDLSFTETTRAWGDEQVRDVLAYGEPATHDAGLAVVDAPSGYAEAATALAAAGAQVVVHVTADGVPTGHPVVPTVKVTGDPDTYAALSEDVDVDAGSSSPADLWERVRSVLDGEPSAAERHGLREFAITRVGPSM